MEEILEKLKELNIEYELVKHNAVFTIEEIELLNENKFYDVNICKNLFLRDQKGKKHFLYILS